MLDQPTHHAREALVELRKHLANSPAALDQLAVIEAQLTWGKRYDELATTIFEGECAFVHDHVGGSMNLRTLRGLAVINGVKDSGATYQEFHSKFSMSAADGITPLDQYVRQYDTVEHVQSGPNGFHDSVRLVVDDLFSFGGRIPYSPLRHSHSDELGLEITVPKYIELKVNHLKRNRAQRHGDAVVAFHDLDVIFSRGFSALEEAVGLARKKCPDFNAGFVPCFGKDLSYEDNMVYAKKIAYYCAEGKRIVGLDMAGAEYDPERTKLDFRDPAHRRKVKEIFDAAGSHLPITLHLGETEYTDMQTFIETIELLRPQRVSHPLTAVLGFLNDNDRKGMEIMRDTGTVAEILIPSNKLTRGINDPVLIQEIFEAFDDFGIPVVLGADASGLHNESFARGAVILYLSGCLSLEQVNRFFRNSIEATFLNPNRSLALKG